MGAIFKQPICSGGLRVSLQFQTYRDILTSDIIHVRFPDMQSIAAFLHVNPSLPNNRRGLGMVFNPTPDAVKDTLGK